MALYLKFLGNLAEQLEQKKILTRGFPAEMEKSAAFLQKSMEPYAVCRRPDRPGRRGKGKDIEILLPRMSR